MDAGPIHLSCDPCIDRSILKIYAVVHGTLDDPFWQQTEKAMRQAADDLGIDFHMELWESFASRAMADEIRSIIRYELDDSAHGHSHNVRQIDGLIVTMPDDIVRSAVADAIHAGIHVFGLNLGYQYATEMGFMGYVAQNEYLAGVLAASEFERRRLASHGVAKRALFVNHDDSDSALRERFRGFNDTLSRSQIEVDQVFVDPNDEFVMVVNIHDIIEPCIYDYVLLGGDESAKPVVSAFKHHHCGAYFDLEKDVPVANDTASRRRMMQMEGNVNLSAPMMIGAFDGREAVYQAIIAETVEFTLTQDNYLQGALPVVLATLYASTGQRLSFPNDRSLYNSGPHVVDISNIPSDTYLACQAEAFPICDKDEDESKGNCPCIDRSRLKIAGVIHGVEGDPFWETVIDGAEQASLDMDFTFEVVQFPLQESDDILHRKMASKIISLCGSGISGIFVSMPSEEVKDAVRFCKQLRIPVVNINAGHRFALDLDVPHIGQIEFIAGMEAGSRMILADVQEGYCLIHEPNNIALVNRCEGFEAALLQANKTFGGVVEVPRDNEAEYRANVETAVQDQEGNWGGIALLVNGDIATALALQIDHQSVALGTFDLGENMFQPLDDGRLLFTVDQQQYMQGSMSVYLLVYAAFSGQTLINKAIETGPFLVEYPPQEYERFCVETNYQTCTQVPKENYNFISDFWLTMGYAAVGVVGGTGLLFLIWMQCCGQKNIVKASQPLFLTILVLGAVICVFAIIPNGVQTTYRYVQDPTTGELTEVPNPDIEFVDMSCMAGPWFYGVGFSIMFSALCAKIHRVKMIYAAGVRLRRTEVGVVDVISVMAIMLALEVTLLLVWTLMYPSQWEREVTEEMDGYVLESVGGCTSEHHHTFLLAQLCFHAACLVYAVLLCWQTSEIPTEFSEGSYIALSVLCIFQVAVLSIPIAYMVENSPDIYYFVTGASLFLQTHTVLLLVFVPKMWRVAIGNDEIPLAGVGRRVARGSSAPTFRTDRSQASMPSGEPGTKSQFGKTSSLAFQPFINDSMRHKFPTGRNNIGNWNGHTSSHNNNQLQESMRVAKMAPLSSDSDSEDELAAKRNGLVARNHLRAGLDTGSSSSSSTIHRPSSKAQIVGNNDQLVDLCAEMARAEGTRDWAYNAANSKSGPDLHLHKSASAGAKPDQHFQRQDSSGVDSSASSGSDNYSLGPGGAKGPLVLSRLPGRSKKRCQNFGEESKAEGCHPEFEPYQSATLPIVPDLQQGHNPQEGADKNPQEASQGSNNTNQKEDVSKEREHQNESELSNLRGKTGITRSDASKAEIFRKPALMAPIRLQKDPKAYGANASLAMGITKARGSFLRKVAESYGSNSLSSSSTLQASFGSKCTKLGGIPNRPKHSLGPRPGAPLDKKSLEFEPAYAALKKVNATDQELGVKTTESTKVGEEPAFYFM